MVKLMRAAFLWAILVVSLIGRADPQNVVEGLADESQLHAFFGRPHVEGDGELRYHAEIWESRTDSRYLPGQVVTVGSAMELSLALDDAGCISRILIESVEL